jgi:hypothetical protein
MSGYEREVYEDECGDPEEMSEADLSFEIRVRILGITASLDYCKTPDELLEAAEKILAWLLKPIVAETATIETAH